MTPGCPEIEEDDTLRDCDGGSTNAIYYDVIDPDTEAGYTYIDYSVFYRYDDKDDTHDPDHEADLEGMTVAPSKSNPGTFDFVSFAQHGTWWGYLRQNLECHGEWQEDCHDAPDKRGTRVNAYVATGSHAMYPDACTNFPILTCGKNGQSVWQWEGDHDGDASWAANDDDSVLKPPDSGFWSWDGRWGEEKTVESPYWRSNAFAPRDENCAEDNDGCVTGIISSAGAGRHARAKVAIARNRVLSRCRRWFGASVAALACAPEGLQQALERRGLGARPSIALTVRRRPPLVSVAGRRSPRRENAPAAAALAQLVGNPLRPGDRLGLRGRIGRGTRLLLRVTQARRLFAATFDVGRQRGQAVLRVERGARKPRLVLVNAGGRTLRPVTIRPIGRVTRSRHP